MNTISTTWTCTLGFLCIHYTSVSTSIPHLAFHHFAAPRLTVIMTYDLPHSTFTQNLYSCKEVKWPPFTDTMDLTHTAQGCHIHNTTRADWSIIFILIIHFEMVRFSNHEGCNFKYNLSHQYALCVPVTVLFTVHSAIHVSVDRETPPFNVWRDCVWAVSFCYWIKPTEWWCWNNICVRTAERSHFRPNIIHSNPDCGAARTKFATYMNLWFTTSHGFTMLTCNIINKPVFWCRLQDTPSIQTNRLWV